MLKQTVLGTATVGAQEHSEVAKFSCQEECEAGSTEVSEGFKKPPKP